MSVPDPYKVLQVDPEAEHEVIEAAYRRLARKYHPDVSPDPESQARMVRINQAWEMLRDPVRRGAVDRARARAQAAAATAAASEARTHASPPPRPSPEDTPPRSAFHARMAAEPEPGWPAGVTGAAQADADPSPAGSRNWTPGRSSTGSGYDAATMRSADSAGPPPGNPSGTVLTFGRYAGWSLGEISRTDLEYLEWLDRMPIGRTYQAEIDALLRARGRRRAETLDGPGQRGLFRRP